MKLKLAAYIASEDWRKKYDSVGDFHEGFAAVVLNHKWGFVNKEGEEVVPPIYNKKEITQLQTLVDTGEVDTGEYEGTKEQQYLEAHEELQLRKKENQYLVHGDLSTRYSYVGPFIDGLAAVKRKLKWGFVNEEGKVVVPLNYDAVENFNKGFALVKRKLKWGFVNEKGKEVVKVKYHEVGDFSEGFARVKLNGKWGFVNTKGKVVIPLKYQLVGYFQEGLAAVQLNDKWGLVNKEGVEVIPPKYDWVEYFHDGFAAVELNGKYGFVNKEGKEVVPPKYTRENVEDIPTIVRLLALRRNISEEEAFKLIVEEMAKQRDV